MRAARPSWRVEHELRRAPGTKEQAGSELDVAGFGGLGIPRLDGGQVFGDAQRVVAATDATSVVIGFQSIGSYRHAVAERLALNDEIPAVSKRPCHRPVEQIGLGGPWLSSEQSAPLPCRAAAVFLMRIVRNTAGSSMAGYQSPSPGG